MAGLSVFEVWPKEGSAPSLTVRSIRSGAWLLHRLSVLTARGRADQAAPPPRAVSRETLAAPYLGSGNLECLVRGVESR